MPMLIRWIGIIFFCVISFFPIRLLRAYGFPYIHPVVGEPIGWDPNQAISYWVDPGKCGRLTNAQAATLVGQMASIWSNIINIKLEQDGLLEEDINGTNYTGYLDTFPCYSEEQCPIDFSKLKGRNIIIFDDDGQIIASVARSKNAKGLGGAQIISGSSKDPENIQAAMIIINCLWIDGLPVDDPVNEFSSIMLHELGHFLGLGHSAVNFFSDIGNQLIYEPIMEGGEWTLLRPDEIAGIKKLYPDSAANLLGTVRGTIYLPNGAEFRGAAITARNIDDPFCEAIGYVSGKNCVSYPSSPDPCSDPSRLGDYEINNLPPGTYVVTLTDIGDRRSTSDLLRQPLAGEAEFWNQGDAAEEDPYDYDLIEVRAGETISGIDFVTSSNTANDDQADFVPPQVIIDLFGEGSGIRCPRDQVDYAALIGVEDPLKDPNLMAGDDGTTVGTNSVDNGTTTTGTTETAGGSAGNGTSGTSPSPTKAKVAAAGCEIVPIQSD